MKKFSFVLMLISCLIIILQTKSVLAKDIIYGPFKISLTASVEEKYSDNIFKSSSNKKDDWIYTQRFHLEVERPLGKKSKLKFHAGSLFEEYADNKNENMTAFYVSGSLELETTDAIFKFNEYWQVTKDSPNSEITERDKRYNNVINASIRTKGEQFSLELKIKNIDDNYAAKKNNDRDKNFGEYGIVARHKILQNASLLLEYDYGKTAYGTSLYPGSNYNQGFIGLEGQLWNKTIYTAKVGYQDRKYDVSTVIDPKEAVTQILFIHPFSEKKQLNLSYQRGLGDSIYKTNNFFRYNSIQTKYKHKINDQLEGNFNIGYELNKYPTETLENGSRHKRLDNIIKYSVELNYRFRQWEWLTASSVYERTERSSNHNTFDYTENRLLLKATAKL